jgi:hypothetical protein
LPSIEGKRVRKYREVREKYMSSFRTFTVHQIYWNGRIKEIKIILGRACEVHTEV